mmetsp:Transcript_31342/g.86272  ORF Transcript_31342/g.86272 Transcript_31342/m.86272 type:complete len:242 (+) Transcript_31342:1380-2105(+)
MFRFAVTDVGLAVHARCHGRRVRPPNEPLLRRAQDSGERPAYSPRRRDLKGIKHALEGPKVPLQQHFIVHHNMRALPKRDNDVNRQGCYNHGLALARADLGDQGMCARRGLRGLQEVPESQEAEDLRVMRQHQQAELSMHGQGPAVEDLAEGAQCVLLPVHTGAWLPKLLKDGGDLAAVQEVAVLCEAHQLRTGRVLALSAAHAGCDQGACVVRLATELGVREAQVLAAGVTQEEQQRLQV